MRENLFLGPFLSLESSFDLFLEYCDEWKGGQAIEILYNKLLIVLSYTKVFYAQIFKFELTVAKFTTFFYFKTPNFEQF